MSAMVPMRNRIRTLYAPGKGAFSGAADVYRARDGIGVVVVGVGVAVKQTPHGPVRVTGKVAIELPSIAAFDHWKRVAFHKNPELYAKTVGVLGIDDDARRAPMLPEGLLTDGPLANATPALELAASGGRAPEGDPMVAVAGFAAQPLRVACEVDGMPTLADLLGVADGRR